jgi:MFS transporter, PPP family, 3-phenylpropionic acid transporter
MGLKKLRRRINLYFSIIQFSSFASSFVIYLYATVILLSKGFSTTIIGITVAAGSGASILLPPVIAAVYTRHLNTPLKRVAAYLRVATLISSVLLIFVDSPVLLVCIIFIMISCTTMSAGALTNAIAMQYENSGIPVNYGIARSLGSLGCAGMGYVSGLLSKGAGGTDAVMVLSIMLLCVTTAVTLILPKKDSVDNIPSRMPIKGSLGLSMLKSAPNILFFLVVVFVWANMAILDTYQVNIIYNVGGSDMDYGILLTVMTLCEVPLTWFFKPLARRFSYVQLMTAGFFFLMMKDLFLIFAPSVTAVILCQGFNIGTMGLFSPALVYYSNAIADPNNSVQAQALYAGTGIAAGRILGSLTGGLILDNLNINALLTVSSGYALICIVILRISNIMHIKKANTSDYSTGNKSKLI